MVIYYIFTVLCLNIFVVFMFIVVLKLYMNASVHIQHSRVNGLVFFLLLRMIFEILSSHIMIEEFMRSVFFTLLKQQDSGNEVITSKENNVQSNGILHESDGAFTFLI